MLQQLTNHSQEDDEYLMDVEDVPPSVIEKLKEKKLTMRSIKSMKLSELSSYIGESMEIASKIMKYVKGENSYMRNKLLQGKVTASPMRSTQPTQSQMGGATSSILSQMGGSHSALALLEKECNPSKCIKTFCKDLDNALGGYGVKTGIITDICGVPGIGKTQCALQLAVDVQMPAIFDGIDGECIYIDTEGSFTIERTKEIAESFINHLNGIAKKNDSDLTKKDAMMNTLKDFTIEKVLSGIYYYRIMSVWELVGLVLVLSELLQREQYSRVKLIIIDSIAFHLRKTTGQDSAKEELLKSIGQSLKTLSQQFDLAVVTTNQVTTKFGNKQDGFGKSTVYYAPSLNHLWNSQVTYSIFLEFVGSERVARIAKGSVGKEQSIPFKITPAGFRGMAKVPQIIEPIEQPPEFNETTDENNKRKRR